jgi:hypothetical protein
VPFFKCAWCFTWITWFNSYKNSVGQVFFLSSFYRWGNWGLEKLSHPSGSHKVPIDTYLSSLLTLTTYCQPWNIATAQPVLIPFSKSNSIAGLCGLFAPSLCESVPPLKPDISKASPVLRRQCVGWQWHGKLVGRSVFWHLLCPYLTVWSGAIASPSWVLLFNEHCGLSQLKHPGASHPKGLLPGHGLDQCIA